jgi:RNA recognition motif-containing protein
MTKLYIGNLPYSATEDIVSAIFEDVGPVQRVAIAKHSDGQSRGFGFVTMQRPEDAAEAIARFNGDIYEGRVVKVEFVKQ